MTAEVWEDRVAYDVCCSCDGKKLLADTIIAI
jgi:hypothetical protein